MRLDPKVARECAAIARSGAMGAMDYQTIALFANLYQAFRMAGGQRVDLGYELPSGLPALAQSACEVAGEAGQ